MASTWAAAGLSDECPAALVIDDERLARLDGILNLSSNEPSSCESSFNKGSEKGRLARSLSFGETPPVDLDAYEEAESIRMRRSSDTADAVRSWNGPFSVLGAAFKSPVDPDDATSDSFTALDGFRKQAKPESPIFSVLRHRVTYPLVTEVIFSVLQCLLGPPVSSRSSSVFSVLQCLLGPPISSTL